MAFRSTRENSHRHHDTRLITKHRPAVVNRIQRLRNILHSDEEDSKLRCLSGSMNRLDVTKVPRSEY